MSDLLFILIQLLCFCWVSSIFTCFFKSKPVKQEFSHSVILPHIVSVLWLSYSATPVKFFNFSFNFRDDGSKPGQHDLRFLSADSVTVQGQAMRRRNKLDRFALHKNIFHRLKGFSYPRELAVSWRSRELFLFTIIYQFRILSFVFRRDFDRRFWL